MSFGARFVAFTAPPLRGTTFNEVGGIGMKRFGFILVAVLVVVMPGCATKDVRWNTTLLSPPESKGTAFSDEKIDIDFSIKESGIAFTLKNKTSQGLKVDWDQLALVMPDGASKRAIHEGVRLMEKSAAQAPAFVAPKSTLTDYLIPAENVYFDSERWRYTPLCSPYITPRAGTTGGVKRFDPSLCEGKTYGVYFPMEIEGSRKEYNFTLRIDSIVKVERR